MPYHEDVRRTADLIVSWSESRTTKEQLYWERDQRHHGCISEFFKEEPCG